MSYQSILVHAEADPKCEPRLKLAADLANQFDANLMGVAAEIFEPDFGGESYFDVDGTLAIAESKAVQDDLKLAEQRFVGVAKTVNAGSEWRSDVDLPDEMISREARAADLIVIGPRRRHAYGLQNRADPGDLLMRSGRPILIAPEGQERLDASSVVVAWKDTREARRAVADAMPFLLRAKQVLVVEICDVKDEEAARFRVADVAEYLSRHGVRASTAVRIQGELTTATTLIDVAGMQEAGLIVAGGFGHTRFREWVFGGVTQELLWYGRVPVLLSH